MATKCQDLQIDTWEKTILSVHGQRSVFRFAGLGNDGGMSYPWSVVLKQIRAPESPDAPDANFNDCAYWEREYLLYQAGVPQTLTGDLRGPDCFGTIERTPNLRWIWLEDLSDRYNEIWPIAQYASVAPEHLRPLAPLRVTAPHLGGADGARISDAARLFAERAAAADPGFVLGPENLNVVESICRRLDGLPLGLELAAARLRSATVGEVAGQLDQRLEVLSTARRGRVTRHGTLEATIEWSYRLIDPAERWLFERLGVFAGGFTLGDAEAMVAHLGGPATQVRKRLAALADQSLVTADRSHPETRYRMLEPLRAYAVSRLGAGAPMEATRRAHADWAVEMAEALAAGLQGPDEADAVARFDAQFANLRAAHAHCVRTADPDRALRLVAGLHRYALHRLRDEVFTWIEASVGLEGADAHPLFPVVAGSLAQGLANRGELTRARLLAERALDLCADGDRRSMWALRALCNVAVYEHARGCARVGAVCFLEAEPAEPHSTEATARRGHEVARGGGSSANLRGSSAGGRGRRSRRTPWARARQRSLLGVRAGGCRARARKAGGSGAGGVEDGARGVDTR
jgi:predicted ATPase